MESILDNFTDDQRRAIEKYYRQKFNYDADFQVLNRLLGIINTQEATKYKVEFTFIGQIIGTGKSITEFCVSKITKAKA